MKTWKGPGSRARSLSGHILICNSSFEWDTRMWSDTTEHRCTRTPRATDGSLSLTYPRSHQPCWQSHKELAVTYNAQVCFPWAIAKSGFLKPELVHCLFFPSEYRILWNFILLDSNHWSRYLCSPACVLIPSLSLALPIISCCSVPLSLPSLHVTKVR